MLYFTLKSSIKYFWDTLYFYILFVEPRDCKVSEWSNWGPCSKTCGIGETLRSRVIDIHPAHGGRHCPALRDFKWCGSARNCNKGYFSW